MPDPQPQTQPQTPTPAPASGKFTPLPAPNLREKAVGVTLGLLVLAVILRIWSPLDWARPAAWILTVIAIALLTPMVRRSRQIFVALALLVAGFAVVTRPDAQEILGRAMDSASFIAAFFCALATLRHSAEISPSIARSAVYLAQQPPGRRYVTLAIGSQIFALLLNYGAISLLGSMARTSAATEPDEEIRKIRTRRMLTGVHRGFASSLVWSPLGFAMVISTTVIAGADWGNIVGPALVCSAVMTLIGWGLDSWFKPKISPAQRAASRARPQNEGPKALLPVVYLLLLIAVPAGILHFVAGASAPDAVLIIVPVVAALWLIWAGNPGHRAEHLGHHAAEFGFSELPAFRSELVLLTMAGFLGNAAGTILAPLVAATGLDIAGLPLWLLLILPIWLIPLGGQFGMNPILFVSLFGPLLPTAAALGISPTPMVVAITSGWALSGVTSPFTASVMLVARLGDVTARDVSVAWNGAYFLMVGVALSAWVLWLA